jgi:hypothetical protein
MYGNHAMENFAPFWAHQRILSFALLHGRLLGKNQSISAVKPNEVSAAISTLPLPR